METVVFLFVHKKCLDFHCMKIMYEVRVVTSADGWYFGIITMDNI